MCGINGFNFINKIILRQMNESLKHRGPDDVGEFFDKKSKISLGHRRLSIIDLSKKGKQPMRYIHKNRKAVIVYNGEIYNFQEIKGELQKKGYLFNSNSDTEVILASYFEYGENCIKKFNGMWAFCIYDLDKEIFFLSRDRVGKKPLYYYFDGEKFIFSSELKGILAHNLELNLNKDAIDLYFSLGFIPAPYSIYEKIWKLEASQNLIFNLKNKRIRKYNYYKIPKYNPIFNKKLLRNRGRDLLKDAVRLRLISDVPLGAFLSGGLDSSAVTSQMANFISTKNLNTFSVGFEGRYDESKYMELIKDTLKTKHHQVSFKEKDFLRLVKKIFYYCDEPLSDDSLFPSFVLSKLAKENVTVSLGGDGGDEIFGGYPKYLFAYQIRVMRTFPKFLRQILYKIIPNKISFFSNLKEGIRLSLLEPKKIYSEARENLYKPPICKKLLENNLEKYLSISDNNLVEAFIIMDIMFYTLGDNFLAKVDRTSMANSLEVRAPFLDYRLLEYSRTIPTKWKVSIFSTKILMKEILKNVLPKKILYRKKKGFTPPILEWIQKKEYQEKLDSSLHELYKKNILSIEWFNFYKNFVFKNDGIIYRNYKIRLLFFHYWYSCWKKNILGFI